MKHAKQGVVMTETKQQIEPQPSNWFRKIVTGSSHMKENNIQRRDFCKTLGVVGSALIIPGVFTSRCAAGASRPAPERRGLSPWAGKSKTAPRAQGICIDDIEALNQMPDQKLLDTGFIDITAAPYSADPSGKRDSTKAIQDAVIFARHHKLAVYFPLGEYLVRDTIMCRGGRSDDRFPDHRFLPFAGELWPCVLVGERRSGKRPVVRLAPASAGFDNSDKVKSVFFFAARHYKRKVPMAPLEDDVYDLSRNINNTALNQTFYGIDVEIGPGNPGAAAIRFGVAEGSTIQDCELRVGEGYAGIHGGPGNGAGLFNISFKGGAVGLYADERVCVMSTVTLAGCRFDDQREAAVFYSQRGPLCLVGCEFSMQTGVPALKTIKSTKATGINGANLVDCRIEYPDGAAGSQPTRATVVVHAGTPIYVCNTWVRNASFMVAGEERDRDNLGKLEDHGWTRVEEFAFAFKSKSNTVPYPIYVDGVKQGNVLEKLDRLADPPPGNLCSRHILWNWESYPAWNDKGVINVRKAPYNAVGDGVTDDTATLQRAIDENEAIFLPKGHYRITATLRLKPRSKIIGVNAAHSMIAPTGSVFADGDHPRPAIQTACTAEAETQLGFFGVFMPEEDAPGASMLAWTCGGLSCIRSVFPAMRIIKHDGLLGLRPWNNWQWDEILPLSRKVGDIASQTIRTSAITGGANAVKKSIPNGPIIHVYGDGGGGFYPFQVLVYPGTKQGPNYRSVLVEGISGPFAIYNANLQWKTGDAELEIRGSSNVSVYGSKNEMNYRIYWIRDSQQVFIYGLGSLGLPSKRFKILIENSHGVVLTTLFLDKAMTYQKVDGIVTRIVDKTITEGPMVSVKMKDNSQYSSDLYDRPTLFRVK